LIKEDVSAGGILLEKVATRDSIAKATVVAVGPGLRDSNGNLIPVAVEVGDVVLIVYNALVTLGRYGEFTDVLMISEPNVLGILS
jgi:chaperonin GroES